MMTQPYEQGGIIGPNQKALIDALKGGQGPTLPGPPAVPGAPDFPGSEPPTQATAQLPSGAAPGSNTQYRGQLGGFDMGKLDAGKNDPKYVFAKYAQGLDVTNPQERAKLQDLLRGDPSGFFKNATIDGDILHGSYNPDTGGVGDVDIIKGLKAGGQGWQWGAMGGPQPASPQGGGGMPSFGGSTINGMLQSDAQGNIQQALGALQQPGMLQQLIAALQGGQ